MVNIEKYITYNHLQTRRSSKLQFPYNKILGYLRSMSFINLEITLYMFEIKNYKTKIWINFFIRTKFILLLFIAELYYNEK